jgi:hypothetical protein
LPGLEHERLFPREDVAHEPAADGIAHAHKYRPDRRYTGDHCLLRADDAVHSDPDRIHVGHQALETLRETLQDTSYQDRGQHRGKVARVLHDHRGLREENAVA